jgi:hypothetical protein
LIHPTPGLAFESCAEKPCFESQPGRWEVQNVYQIDRLLNSAEVLPDPPCNARCPPVRFMTNLHIRVVAN